MTLSCRPGCGACCIAPSISSAIPGMPHGKPAGVRCAQLDEALQCRIFDDPSRPACCSGLQPSVQMCGSNRDEALAWLTRLEILTNPAGQDRAIVLCQQEQGSASESGNNSCGPA